MMTDKTERDALSLVALAIMDGSGCSKRAALADAESIPDETRREIATAPRTRRPALVLAYLQQQDSNPAGQENTDPPAQKGKARK